MRQCVAGTSLHVSDKGQLGKTPAFAPVCVADRTDEQVGKLKQAHFVGMDSVQIDNSLPLEIMDAVAEDIMQFSALDCALSVFVVEEDAVHSFRLNHGLEHTEVHLVVPLVMTLAKTRMVEDALIRDNKCTKMKVIRAEEEVHGGVIEVELCR